MKLFDKIKDLFMDEIVEDEEEEEFPEPVEKPKKEKKKDELPKVMQETIRKEEKVDIEVKPEKNNTVFKKEDFKDFSFKEEKEIKTNSVKDFENTFNFFDEVPQRRANRNVMDEFDFGSKLKSKKKEEDIIQEPVKKVTELYTKKEETIEKPKFKASPVISPVYGVLDKNYKKDEVKEKSEEMVEMKRPSKKVDFETVRRKAFGNLVEDIKDNLLCENCELYKEVKKISALREDDLFYDMTVDDTNKGITIEKAYDNYEEFGVAYEPKKVKEEVVDEEDKLEDMLMQDDIKEVEKKDDVLDESESKIEELKKEEEKIEEVIDEEKIPSRENKKKETKVDEDFFELIDSMYKERVDE